MKVLKEGRDQKGWAMEVACDRDGGCGAILLVEEGDLTCWTHHDYGGGSDQYCSFHCGHCGQEVVVSSIAIPSDVIDRRLDK